MKKIDLTKGKVLKVLTVLALPIIGNSLLQFTYNLVDMLWVGALGSNAVASIGSSSLFIGLGYSINSLVVMGTGIKVSHAIGKKNDDEVKSYINSGLILNTIIALVYAISLIFMRNTFIGILNLNNPIVEKDAYLYLIISAPTMFFSFFNILYIRIFNSFGNNKDALKISALGVIINIILDPIFIYVFNLGVTGAAIATLVSNLFMFIMFNLKSNGMFKINIKDKIDYEKIKEIGSLGLPSAIQRVLFTIVNIILARIITQFGTDAIAAQKIGLQIESIVYMIIGGLSGAMASFVGQNFGAKKYERINEGYNKAIIIGMIYAGITTVIFMFIPEPIVKIFIREETTVKIASNYLRIIGFTQIFSTIEMISNGVFIGVGRPKISATISVLFIISRIPMALVFTRYLGVNGVWLSISISSMCKGIISYLIYKFKIWKEYKNVTCS